MEPHLLVLVSDLIQDRGLRFHFNQNPKEVIKLYGLKGKEKNCLLSMNRELIGDFIAEQFIQWGFPDDGFPVNEECVDPASTTDYPSPVPKMFKVDPEIVNASGADREFYIHGQSFAPHANLTLSRQTTGEVLSPGTYSFDVRGTYRCSHVYVYLDDPANIPTGTYDIELRWGGGKYRTTLDGRSVVFS